MVHKQIMMEPGKALDTTEGEAVETFARALRLVHAGKLEAARSAFAQAIPLYEKIIASEPANQSAWSDLSSAYYNLDQYDKALRATITALTLNPNNVATNHNAAMLAGDLGRFADQLELIDRAMRLDPNNPEIRYSAARFSLREGWFKPGWELYESRWKLREQRQIVNIKSLAARHWQGQSLAQKTLIVWDEHGYGDSIQFLRYLSPVCARARNQDGKVILLCRPSLLDLYRRSLQDQCAYRFSFYPLSAQLSIPDIPFNFHCPISALPRQIQDSSVPPLVPLIPDPEKSTRWQEQLASAKGLKVGIAWTGRPDHLRNHKRSFNPGELIQRLKDLPVTLYSLQKNMAEQSKAAGLIDYTAEWANFDDTASFISLLNIAISCDGVVAHLAGSLNVPVLVALDLNPHWAWGRQGLITPWYGSAKLFRQKCLFDWSTVFREIREDLIALVEKKQTPNVAGR